MALKQHSALDKGSVLKVWPPTAESSGNACLKQISGKIPGELELLGQDPEVHNNKQAPRLSLCIKVWETLD